MFSSDVCCAIDSFGPTAFDRMDEQQTIEGAQIHNEDSPETSFMGFSPLQSNLAAVKRASPLSYLSKNDTAPIFVSHGDADKLVPVGRSRALVDQLQALDIIHEYYELKGAEHGGEEFNQENHFPKMLAFLQEECPLANAH